MKLWTPAVLTALALGGGAVAGGGQAPSAGERAFEKCYACHSLAGPDPALQGPSLKGVVGRPIAAEPGFAYSPAMRAYAARQKVWTREALDAFAADPQATVPDNAMGFFGMREAAERRALIAYLAAR